MPRHLTRHWIRATEQSLGQRLAILANGAAARASWLDSYLASSAAYHTTPEGCIFAHFFAKNVLVSAPGMPPKIVAGNEGIEPATQLICRIIANLPGRLSRCDQCPVESYPLMGRVWTALRWQGFSEDVHSAGRGGHVFGLSMRLRYAPLAMMPFARTGSRPIARARSATAQNGFSRSGGFNRLGASIPLCPFQLRSREGSR